MRSIFLAVTTLLIVAAGPVSFAAQQATANAHQESQHIDGGKIDNQCDSILANPAGRSVIDVAQCRSKKE